MGEEALDLAELQRLGVYDPAAIDADEVREYLEWLADQGFDVVELARTTPMESFGAATAALGIRIDLHPLVELESYGMSEDRIAELGRAFGFSADVVRRGMFSQAEIDVLFSAELGIRQFTPAEVLYYARVVGASLSRIAEAGVSLFMIDVEGGFRGKGLTRREEAEQAARARDALQSVIGGLDPLFRLHMAQAIERINMSANETSSEDAILQAVGFVDLVGFSTWSAEIALSELSVVVREFEARADELVSRKGSRLVKTVGDAVMFTALSPEAVARAAIALIEELGRHAGVEARGGLTYGDVLIRGGDYYGPLVNLASRLGDLAVPGELLATPEFAAALPDDLAFEPAGLRQLKGFAHPVQAVSRLV